MKTVRRVTTASSVWTFDDGAGTYTRAPRVEGATHPRVPYMTPPCPYARVQPHPAPGDPRLVVTHPDGSYLITGAVVLDAITVDVTS